MEPSRTSSPGLASDPAAAAATANPTDKGWKGKRVGRFKLLDLLGQGAMGKVFRAEDTTLHRLVALKALPRVFRTRNYTINAEQLIREARSAAAIEHPHVVQIYEAGDANGVFYIAMELVEGGTIHELVRGAGPLDPQHACQITAEAAEALDYAHRLGIVHRDIKPSNLMLTRAGRCKVVDFGLARVEDANGTFVPLGETVGTAYFVAPEVIAGGQATPKSDIYSLAATLYLLLAGRVPYEGESKAKILKQHMSAPPPDLTQVRPDLPESLVKLVARGMAKRPEDRFESAGQFAKALRVQTIPIAGASGPIVPPGPLSGEMSSSQASTARTASRQRIPYVVGAVVLGLGIIAAIVIAVVLAHSGSKSDTASVANNAAPTAGPAVVRGLDNTAKPPDEPKTQPAVAVAPDPAPPAIPTKTQAEPPPGPPANPPAPAALPAGVVDADDAAALMRIAKGEDPKHSDRRVTVEGTPQSAELSSTGKVFRIEFAGSNGDDALLAAYFPASNLFARMGKKFGGTNGEGLAGKRLRIKGSVEVYSSRPEIVIFSPDQVEIVP